MMKEQTTGNYKVWEPLLLSIAVVVGMFAGAGIAGTGLLSGLKKEKTPSTAASVSEIIRFIEEKYVDDIAGDDLVEHAVQGIMDGLDPHSGYISPGDLSRINERMDGHFEGVGLQFHLLRDSIVILFLNEGGPALNAGLQQHDRIITADGESLVATDWTMEKYVDKLRGPKGSTLVLEVKRRGVDTLMRFEVVRAKIDMPSVSAAYMLDDLTGYIRIKNFSSSTYKEFMQHLEEMIEEDNMKNLVIDLRDNPGGYLKEAVNILSQLFAEKGLLLVYTEGENTKRMEYKSTGKPFYPVGNIAVLINEGSASASEIIAGAIQDHDRGVILGTRSYGKGLVQEQYLLHDGGALRLTTARYYTPSGRSIQTPYVNGYANMDTSSQNRDSVAYHTDGGREVFAEGGITPDVVVEERFLWNDEDLFLTYDRLMDFMFYGFDDGIEDSLDTYETYLDNFPSRDVLLQDVTRFFGLSKGTQEYLNVSQDWERAYTLIRAMAASYHYGDEVWFRVVNNDDPMILKARELVQSDTRTTLKLDLE